MTGERISSDELAALLRDQILTRQLPPEAKLPSVRWLHETHGVSTILVRAAIDTLKHEGLVVTRQGQATRVRKEHPKRQLDMTDVVRVEVRMPYTPERKSMPDDPGAGVPILVVWRAGDRNPTLLPGDRWMIPGPASGAAGP
ncbi:winged helix-turn-helix domain-containing protein [Micromonospora sp. NPDC000207]|uniref:winged helix-turn-helix domain-containing protein n=1 Tax=Micromonospora sp. NPDC000207 TaxID=3154246 RepID=UPI0033240FE1